ncbi:MAG: tetratricopeptide repeat protein [Gemmatimonadota bacterium]
MRKSAESLPREAGVRISVGALLLESARRIDEWSLIRSKIGHLSVVPRLAANPGDEPGSLVLTPFEWRVLAGCDGIRDVQSIAVTLGEPEFDVARSLFGLVVAGVIQIRDPVAESTARAPRNDADPLLGQAEQLIRSRNYDAARETARTIAATFPDDPRGLLVLGRTFLAERRFAEAEAPLREAVRLDPGSPRALRLLSWALLGAGRLDESVHGFEAWLAWPALGPEEEQQVSAVGAAIPAARQLAALLRGAHD